MTDIIETHHPLGSRNASPSSISHETGNAGASHGNSAQRAPQARRERITQTLAELRPWIKAGHRDLIPLVEGGKIPRTHEWQKRDFMPEIERLVAAGANFGLRTDRYCAIDIEGSALASKIAALVEARFPDAPKRTRDGTASCAFLFVADGPLPRWSILRPPGVEGDSVKLVETLCGCGQLHVGGTRADKDHARLMWSGIPDVLDLPAINAEEQRRLGEGIVAMLRAEGLDARLAGGGEAKPAEATGDREPERLPIDLLREVVAAIPRDEYFVENRDANIAMLHAIAGASGKSPEGREIWLDWDASNDVSDPAKAEAYWDRLGEVRSGAGYICQQLERLGQDKLLGRVKLEMARAAFDAGEGEETLEDDAEEILWPEPKPMPLLLAPVRPFDPTMLPRAIRPWVLDIAERMQTSLDILAVTAMTALGAVLGSRIALRPNKEDDWSEVPNLWGMPIARPGMLKSPSIDAILKPVRKLEADAREAHRKALTAHEQKLAEYELRKKAVAKAATDRIKKDPMAEVDMNVGDPPAPPVRRTYIETDLTYEKAGEIAAGNPNGFMMFRDEIMAFVRSLSQEERADARGFWLQAWGGQSSYSFARIGRGEIFIPKLCVSVLGATQPAVIGNFIDRVRRGDGDDGLLQRFNLMVWPDLANDFKLVDRAADTRARNAAYDVFEALAKLEPMEIGATQDRFDDTPYLRLSPEAYEAYVDWRIGFERTLRSGALSDEALESHVAKHRKTVCAIALITHLANGDRGPVSLEAWTTAMTWLDYLEDHARRIYGADGMQEIRAAHEILGRIRSGALAGGFTVRDIWRHKWSGLSNLDTVKAGVELLTDLGYLRPAKAAGVKGGAPLVTYGINPKARV